MNSDKHKQNKSDLKKNKSGLSHNSESDDSSIDSSIDSVSDESSDDDDEQTHPQVNVIITKRTSNPKLKSSQSITTDSSNKLSEQDQNLSTGTGVEEPRRETGYLAAAHLWRVDLRKLMNTPDNSDLTATPEDCKKFTELLINNDKLDQKTINDLKQIANKLTTNNNVTEADLKTVFDNVPISILTSYPNVMILVLIKIIEQQVIEYNDLDTDASIDDIAVKYQTILELAMAFEKLYDFKYKYKNSGKIGDYVKSKFQNNFNIRTHALKWHGLERRKEDAHINFAGPNDKVKKDKHFGWFGSIHRHPIKFFCCFGIGCLGLPYAVGTAGGTAVITSIGNLLLGALNSLGAALSSVAGTQFSSGFIFLGLNNSTKQTPIVFNNRDVQPLIDYDLNSAIEGDDEKRSFDEIINRMFIKADKSGGDKYEICSSILKDIDTHVFEFTNADSITNTTECKLDFSEFYLQRNKFIETIKHRVDQNTPPATIMNDFFNLLNNTITDLNFSRFNNCPKVIVKHLNKLKSDIETTIMTLPSPQKILFARIIHLLKNSIQPAEVTRLLRFKLRGKKILNWTGWFTRLNITLPKIDFRKGGNTKRKISLVKKRTSTSRIRRFTKRTSMSRIRRFTKRVL